MGRWARLPASRDRASLKPLLTSKSIDTHRDQEPSTPQVLFWLPLSRPQGFLCFLEKVQWPALRRRPKPHSTRPRPGATGIRLCPS